MWVRFEIIKRNSYSNLGEIDENYFKKVININVGNVEIEKEYL